MIKLIGLFYNLFNSVSVSHMSEAESFNDAKTSQPCHGY